MKIEDLFSIINNELSDDKKLDEFKDLLNNTKIEDYEKYIDHQPGLYTRSPVIKNENLEALILCWDVNISSPYHKHPSNGCLMKVLEGTLTEKRRSNDEQEIVMDLDQYSVSYIHDDLGEHKIENNGSKRVVSLHFYSPPNFYTK